MYYYSSYGHQQTPSHSKEQALVIIVNKSKFTGVNCHIWQFTDNKKYINALKNIEF